MAGFYYFIPETPTAKVAGGNRKLNRDTLKECGLADVLRDCEAAPDDVVVTEVRTGPNGGPGVCLYAKSDRGTDPPTWTYNAERQQWMEAGGCWIGWDKEHPPGQIDLQRKLILSDYSVTDAHGREWHVPCARTTDSQRSSLPVEYAFAGDDLVKHIAPAYLDLWELSGQVLDHLKGSEERDEPWLVKAALQVLQVNYRLGLVEITALQEMGQAVLTKRTVAAVLLALVDNNLEQEVIEQKKTTTTADLPSLSAVG
jgi:hypothetical protein